MHKRILIKLSGEQLSGSQEFGIDAAVARHLAAELKAAVSLGCQIAIIVGGGNMVRGAELAGKSSIRRVTADQMGMLSGLMNAMALTDIFESEGLPTRCLSNVYVEQLAESYSYRLAEKHLQNGRVLLVAGGTGRPYSTHDTAAVLTGLELDCELVAKATNVDGVYDDDPRKNPQAVLYQTLSYQEALENPRIKVMDRAALGMASDHKMPLRVFNIATPGAIAALARGDDVGTLVA